MMAKVATKGVLIRRRPRVRGDDERHLLGVLPLRRLLWYGDGAAVSGDGVMIGSSLYEIGVESGSGVSCGSSSTSRGGGGE